MIIRLFALSNDAQWPCIPAVRAIILIAATLSA